MSSVDPSTLNIREDSKMRIHYLQHVPFETPELILDWAAMRGHAVRSTLLYQQQQQLPKAEEYDLLVVMGGPMGTKDEAKFPFLVQEKRCIAAAVAAGKSVLGICLGAQLIAESLGGQVYRNEHKEIGWHPLQLTAEGKSHPLFSHFPASFTAFHWHGDTFSLPPQATWIASSDGCAHQAFTVGNRVVGLQFHLESTPASIRELAEQCENDITPGAYVQTKDELLISSPYASHCQELLFMLLDKLEQEN